MLATSIPMVTGSIDEMDLVGEAYSYAEEYPSDDEHLDVHGEGVEEDADQEEEGGRLHGGLPPQFGAHPRGEEAGDEGGQVEGRGEELQGVVVILAVVVLLRSVFPHSKDREFYAAGFGEEELRPHLLRK
ncbi:unnamed protein product [Spirodela intermedia]|uniref:Uncharacterized protein n=2 Tax=Spirodela intermedia TaxID=51605 RepID=A0A7I8KCE2_SPIIN|nr:unnamed protein product [Spirodela intermedia]CAA6659154.1 unnamed protein product [Spirodela intermedia]CAA7395459.1 unnamed protein product [Spirodela intermedia]